MEMETCGFGKVHVRSWEAPSPKVAFVLGTPQLYLHIYEK